MNRPASHLLDRNGADTRLAPRIALVLLVKILGLAVLWFLFVRDQRVPVDAHRTASAFGLAGAAAISKMKLEGNVNGQ
jgi:hypothetical protein